MKAHHRTALLAALLTLGFVSPFLVGFVAERHLREIRWALGAPSGTGSLREPRPSDDVKSLRFRFDLVRVGMRRSDVEAMLGTPTQDKWIDPTHAETWFTEAHGVTHGIWGPPWKVYWLFTSVDDKSQWWSSDRCQAFVLYDATGIATGKMWLEERHPGESRSDWPRSFAFVSITACCVWITVRIVNRRQRWSRRTRVAAAVFSIPAAYLVAFGPACWITSRTGHGGEVVSTVYQPILKVIFDSPPLVSAAIVSYGHLFSADGWRFSGPASVEDSNGVRRTDDMCHWQPEP